MPTLTGILGDPVAHSLSPAMHDAAFAKLGLDWRYEAIRVSPNEFKRRVGSLEGEGYVGVNVTLPHKLMALEVADVASDAARTIGAVNTLSFHRGEISAENTDAFGFQDALEELGVTEMAEHGALLLGAGGTARAAMWALLDRGVGELKVWNRTAERAGKMIEELGCHFGGSSIELVKNPRDAVTDCDMIVNTTSIGLADCGSDEEELDMLHLLPSDMREGLTVVDFVYRKGGTAIVNVAEGRGAETVDGLEILVRQGARSFEIWTGMTAPMDVMRKAISGVRSCNDASLQDLTPPKKSPS